MNEVFIQTKPDSLTPRHLLHAIPLIMKDTYLGRLFSKRFHDTQCTQILQLRDIQAIPLRVIWISDLDSSY